MAELHEPLDYLSRRLELESLNKCACWAFYREHGNITLKPHIYEGRERTAHLRTFKSHVSQYCKIFPLFYIKLIYFFLNWFMLRTLNDCTTFQLAREWEVGEIHNVYQTNRVDISCVKLYMYMMDNDGVTCPTKQILVVQRMPGAFWKSKKFTPGFELESQGSVSSEARRITTRPSRSR